MRLSRFSLTPLAISVVALLLGAACQPSTGVRQGQGHSQRQDQRQSGGVAEPAPAPGARFGDVAGGTDRVEVPPPAPLPDLPGALSGGGAAPSPTPAAVAAAAAAGTPGGTIAVDPLWKTGGFQGEKAMEDAIVRYVNALRKRLGLGTLLPDERLRTSARQHTLEMLSRGYYSHTSPVAAWSSVVKRACHAGFWDPFVSENIGMVAGFADPAAALHDSWVKSPGHYANLVAANITHVGVGVWSAMKNGRRVYYGTQNFASSLLDFRRVVIRPERRRVVQAVVDLALPADVQVKLWLGRQYRGDVPRVAGGARFVTELTLPIPSKQTYHFAITKGGSTPLMCAHATVFPSGALRANRITYAPPCRQITGIRATSKILRVTRSVFAGEVKANVSSALKTRYFFDHQWGAPLRLALGRWVPFSRTLTARKTLFSLVVGKYQKDYLRIDLDGRPAYSCP